jgi:hypothetical protein
MIWPVLAAVTAAPALFAQSAVTDTNLHGWLVYNGDHGIAGRWGLHLEGHFRRHNALNAWQQLLLRPGLNFQASRDVMLTGGYAYIRTHRYGDYPLTARFSEHRIYQQAILRSRTGTLEFQQRPRLEQRWLAVVAAPGEQPRFWRRQGRFRYLSRAAVPVGKRGWYLAVQDEIFLNFGASKGARVFDQNRLSGAVGRQLGRAGRLEWGYLNQYLAQRNGRVFENNHTIQVVFISSLRFRK